MQSPREVVERLFQELPARDADRFVALLAPDAVFEIPFAVPGMPTRLRGRDEIRRHLEQRWSGLTDIQVHGIHPVVYETTDPEVVLVENEVDMSRPNAPRERVRTSVNVIRVRDGEVVLFRDYMDTARTARLSTHQTS
ncbi:nuclear transport factor 2 family protein [Nocardia bovistercoris]|uniref:Nuclear transport factor 2 family protein n=1 Tax=Nocardia bovistercoris TaxID=2785916 RepID=A0A931N0Y1_9NOCA|nr:nuclear transport factor 2 family protein [Nocardia bovistercoris]MBH0777785.1 nuclear transport factor 2 family protein [Nocardia bovistercoris]